MRKIRLRLTLLRSAFTYQCALEVFRRYEPSRASSTSMMDQLGRNIILTPLYLGCKLVIPELERRLSFYQQQSALQKLHLNN